MTEYIYDPSLDDERNARDHRTDNRTGRVPGMVPVPIGRRAVPVYPGSAVAPRQVVIYQPPAAQERTGLLGNLTTDEVVELAAQIFAAIQPLPLAPVASGEVGTDVENLITYQGALALHAKRDEQLRTIGSLLSKLLAK